MTQTKTWPTYYNHKTQRDRDGNIPSPKNKLQKLLQNLLTNGQKHDTINTERLRENTSIYYITGGLMTMKRMVNEMVQIHEGYASVGGMFIHEKFTTGTVVKVNKKSIRVHMTHAKCTTNGKVTREYDVNEEAAFTFWKTIENKQLGKNVDIYKNSRYGIIEIAH